MKKETIVNEALGMNQVQEGLKVFRNETAKGDAYYTWEIKVVGVDVDKVSEIDKSLRDKFPRESNNA